MVYSPSKDTVAGRTAAQIDAAKRRAVKGSGKKRCKKGKSCGATCINASKVCMVDLPWVSAQGLSKVSKEIQKVSNPNPQPKPIKEPEKSSIKLSSLENAEDFKKKVYDTYDVADNPKLKADSIEVARVLGTKSTSFPYLGLYNSDGPEQKYKEIRKKEEGILADGANALSAYTGSFDTAKAIRDADRGIYNPNFLDHEKERYKHLSDSLNNLLTSKVMPRTEVEKFRGFRATPESLTEMIESARNKENFTHDSTYSWSSALREGRRFANREIYQLPERTERVIFRTINKRGVPIEYVTNVSGEDEILTPRGTKYRYLGYRMVNDGNKDFHVFDVEEFS